MAGALCIKAYAVTVAGLLMVLNVFEERGMHTIELDWSNDVQCRFPLFDFLQPLRLEYMYMVYLLMMLG